MMIAKTKVTALAMVTGILLLKIPNSNHSNVPAAKSEYIDREILPVSFVLMVFNACGTNDAVVNTAAAKPVIVMKSILIFLL